MRDGQFSIFFDEHHFQRNNKLQDEISMDEKSPRVYYFTELFSRSIFTVFSSGLQYPSQDVVVVYTIP